MKKKILQLMMIQFSDGVLGLIEIAGKTWKNSREKKKN